MPAIGGAPRHTMILTAPLPRCDASGCLQGLWVNKAPLLSQCLLEKGVSLSGSLCPPTQEPGTGL